MIASPDTRPHVGAANFSPATPASEILGQVGNDTRAYVVKGHEEVPSHFTGQITPTTPELLNELAVAEAEGNIAGELGIRRALLSRLDFRELEADIERVERYKAAGHIALQDVVDHKHAIADEIERRGGPQNAMYYRPPLRMEHFWGPRSRESGEPATTVLGALPMDALNIIAQQNAAAQHEIDSDEAYELYHIIRIMNGEPDTIDEAGKKRHIPHDIRSEKPEKHDLRTLQGTHLLDMFSADSEAAQDAGTTLTPEALKFIKALYDVRNNPSKQSYYLLKLERMEKSGMFDTISRQMVPAHWEVGENGHASPVFSEVGEDGRYHPAKSIPFKRFLMDQFGLSRPPTPETPIGALLKTKVIIGAGAVANRELQPKTSKGPSKVGAFLRNRPDTP